MSQHTGLHFRPTSYADFDDPVALSLNGIAGQMRREMVRDMLTAEGERRDQYDGILGPIALEILEERAPASFIQNLSNAWGPSWLGGEYLPSLRRGEVEIARVVLQSTTMDVFSLRARWGGGRYHYRLVDEYGNQFWLCRKTSRRTLTLGQLVELMETVDSPDLTLEGRGVVVPWWEQQADYGYDPESCIAFATVESDQYPGLTAWYDGRAEAWTEKRFPDHAAADGEDDEE